MRNLTRFIFTDRSGRASWYAKMEIDFAWNFQIYRTLARLEIFQLDSGKFGGDRDWNIVFHFEVEARIMDGLITTNFYYSWANLA